MLNTKLLGPERQNGGLHTGRLFQDCERRRGSLTCFFSFIYALFFYKVVNYKYKRFVKKKLFRVNTLIRYLITYTFIGPCKRTQFFVSCNRLLEPALFPVNDPKSLTWSGGQPENIHFDILNMTEFMHNILAWIY